MTRQRTCFIAAICFCQFFVSSQLGAEPKLVRNYPNHRDLMVYIDRAGALQPVKSASQWNVRRTHILAGMQAAMGLLPLRKELPPLDVQIHEREKGDGYERQTISFAVENGKVGGKPHRLSAYLYIPDGIGKDERRAGVLALHPTHAIGKGVVDGQSERPNRAYGKEMAQRGYVVIAPDYPSFGEQKQYDFASDAYSSGTMKGIVNHMRCVDLLASRDDVDAKRIGAIGHSLGGHNAMFVGVFDTRLKVIVSSCGWTPFHDYYGGRIAGWTSDRYMPRLRDIYKLDADRVPFDFYEVVAAIAPRAFFSNSPLRDGNFNFEGVKKAEKEASKVYSLLGKKNQLDVHYPDARHDFPTGVRRKAYLFMDKALGQRPVRQVLKSQE